MQPIKINNNKQIIKVSFSNPRFFYYSIIFGNNLGSSSNALPISIS